MDFKELLEEIPLWEIAWVPRIDNNMEAHSLTKWCDVTDVLDYIALDVLPQLSEGKHFFFLLVAIGLF